MDAQEILQLYHDGLISENECWTRLSSVGQSRKPEFVLESHPSKIYEPLNKYELEAIKALQKVHFGMARGKRRFAEQIKDKAELTARQREYLGGLVWIYRKQIFNKKTGDQKAKSYIEKMKNP